MEVRKHPSGARRRDTTRYALCAAFAALAMLALGVGSSRADAPPSGDDVGTPAATTVTATQISVDEARQAASQPGVVDVEGSIPSSPNPSTPYVCYRTGWNDLWTEWGYYWYRQRVYETRTWCGYLNAYQTYRVSGVHGGSDWCDWGAPMHVYRTAGGNGYFYTTVNSGVHFSCPNPWPPWLPGHNYDDWQKWRCNMAGYCTWVDAGRS
jgi:hypothetical protein